MHRDTLHGGAQLILRVLRQRYWILGARSAVKGRIKRCVTCARHSARSPHQSMGDLPASRVNPSPLFAYTGDRLRRSFSCDSICWSVQARRPARTTLLYLSASLLEPSTWSLSRIAPFRLSLLPFGGSPVVRSSPRRVYSDNATNFHGANRELQRCLAFLIRDSSFRLLGNRRHRLAFYPVGRSSFRWSLEGRY